MYRFLLIALVACGGGQRPSAPPPGSNVATSRGVEIVLVKVTAKRIGSIVSYTGFSFSGAENVVFGAMITAPGTYTCGDAKGTNLSHTHNGSYSSSIGGGCTITVTDYSAKRFSGTYTAKLSFPPTTPPCDAVPQDKRATTPCRTSDFFEVEVSGKFEAGIE